MSRCLPERWRRVAADASVIINLNATGHARDILRVFPAAPVVTAEARAELLAGQSKAYTGFADLEALVEAGLYRIAPLPDDAGLFTSLVSGRAADTLGDGEAATIAYAVTHGRAAMIDERKALRICTERFPDLTVVATVDLLLHPAVREALGEAGQADAILGALSGARMRVPSERIPEVVAVIGEERAARCSSLPQSARRRRDGQP